MDLPELVTRGQALAAGLPARTVDDLVRRRRWQPLLPQVYRTRRGAGTAAERVRAAALWAGPDAVLTGLGAAWWLGLPVAPPATLEFRAPRRRPRVGRTVAVRPGAVDPADLHRAGGVLVTGRARTALDAAVEMGAAGTGLLAVCGVAFSELDAALRRRAGTPGAVGAVAVLRDLRHSWSIDSACRPRMDDLRVTLPPPGSCPRPGTSGSPFRGGARRTREQAPSAPGYREL